MRLFVVFLLFSFLTASLSHGAYQTELEHTFSMEGSSWGIEGNLKAKLNIPEADLPEVFRIPLSRPQPNILSLKSEPLAKGLFINDTIFLYNKMSICMDAKIPYYTQGFQTALNEFLYKLTQTTRFSQSFGLKFIDFDFAHMNPTTAAKCDVFALVGDAHQFPFSQVDNQSAPSFSKIPQMILGLYYRHSDSTIPVIVFNPSLTLNFNATHGEYLRTNERNELVADARILFFHELGHLFGLSHLRDAGQWKPSSSLTVMGVDYSQSEFRSSDLRYQTNFTIWENWDIRQTSIYRAIFSRWSQGELLPKDSALFDYKFGAGTFCVLPEETIHIPFTPLRITGLPDVDKGVTDPQRRTDFDLTTIGKSTTSTSDYLQMQFDLTTNETLSVLEYGNLTGQPFFTPLNLQKSISQTEEVADLSASSDPATYSEKWLLLSLLGKMNIQTPGHFTLFGTYGVNHTIKLSFPSIKLQVEEDQRRCYQTGESN